MSTITTISIQKENLTMKYDLIDDDMEKSVTAEDLLLAAFNLIAYLYSQNALVKAYYDLDPDSMARRKKSDSVRKYSPVYAQDKDE